MFILLTILGNEKFHQHGVGILAEVLPGYVTTDQVARCGRSIFQRKKRSQDGESGALFYNKYPQGSNLVPRALAHYHVMALAL